jgi:hypothetical protein
MRRFSAIGGARRGGPRGLSSGILQRVYGIRSFANTAGYATSAGAGEQGNATVGFTVVYLMSVEDQGVASRDRWLRGANDGTGTTHGWQLITRTTNSTIRGSIRQTGGAAFTSTSSFTITSGMLEKIMHVALVVDVVGGFMALYVDGALVGTTTAISAYTVADTSVVDELGKLASTSGADGTTTYGFASGHGPMSAAELVAHRAACLAAGDIVPVSGASITATHTYSVKSAVIAAGTTSSAPTTLADSTGSSDFTKTGSPTVVVRTNPPWA